MKMTGRLYSTDVGKKTVRIKLVWSELNLWQKVTKVPLKALTTKKESAFVLPYPTIFKNLTLTTFLQHWTNVCVIVISTLVDHVIVLHWRINSIHKWNTSHCQIYFQLHNLKKSIVFMCEKCCRDSTEGTMKDEVIIEKTSLSWDRQCSSKAGDIWVDIVKIWYWSYKAFYLMAELIEGISLYSDLAKRWVDGWVNEFKTN